MKYLKRYVDLMSYSADFLNICCDVLFEGNEAFETELGMVACLQDGVFEAISVIPPFGLFRPGDTYPLEFTFCQQILDQRQIVMLTSHDGQPGLRKHPFYPAFGYEFFAGAPIEIENEVWGAVCFASRNIRTSPVEADALRILAAGAAEIAAAHHYALPIQNQKMQQDLAPVLSAPVADEKEPRPGCIIALPQPRELPQVPAANA